MVPDKLTWLFNLIPKWMRSLPLLRKFYWQEDEIEEAQERGQEFAETFGLLWTDPTGRTWKQNPICQRKGHQGHVQNWEGCNPYCPECYLLWFKYW